MRAARRWIRQQRRGTERAGLVASSSAQRLKPHAIDIRVNIDPVHWFLSPAKDTRSSLYLEDAATEFQVQGLELDWTIVTWDADLRWSGDDWSYHSFRGANWTDVKKPERQQYLKNAYRVLLTRARQGMVIFVPPGAKRDKTRRPRFYERAYAHQPGIGEPRDVASGPIQCPMVCTYLQRNAFRRRVSNFCLFSNGIQATASRVAHRCCHELTALVRRERYRAARRQVRVILLGAFNHRTSATPPLTGSADERIRVCLSLFRCSSMPCRGDVTIVVQAVPLVLGSIVFGVRILTDRVLKAFAELVHAYSDRIFRIWVVTPWLSSEDDDEDALLLLLDSVRRSRGCSVIVVTRPLAKQVPLNPRDQGRPREVARPHDHDPT